MSKITLSHLQFFIRIALGIFLLVSGICYSSYYISGLVHGLIGAYFIYKGITLYEGQGFLSRLSTFNRQPKTNRLNLEEMSKKLDEAIENMTDEEWERIIGPPPTEEEIAKTKEWELLRKVIQAFRSDLAEDSNANELFTTPDEKVFLTYQMAWDNICGAPKVDKTIRRWNKNECEEEAERMEYEGYAGMFGGE